MLAQSDQNQEPLPDLATVYQALGQDAKSMVEDLKLGTDYMAHSYRHAASTAILAVALGILFVISPYGDVFIVGIILLIVGLYYIRLSYWSIRRYRQFIRRYAGLFAAVEKLK